MRSTTIAAVTAALLLSLAPRARAEALRIETLGEHTWQASVAALQTDRNSEGHVVSVVVREGDGQKLHCGTYALGLDAVGSEAFEIGGCDSASDATAVRLVHRAALFEHGDVVPRPRAPRIVASRTQTGTASGGATSGAESTVDCSVTVHPFVRDLENGGRVDLAPGRYALRTRKDDVQVKPVADGWTFVAPRGSNMTVEYFVTDSQKEEVVLNDRVTMNCSVQTSAGSGAPPPSRVTHPPSADTTQPTTGDEDSHKSTAGEWSGRAFTANLGVGTAYMRTADLRLANNTTLSDAAGLGLHDAAGPVVYLGGSFERPGIYSSLGVSAAAVSERRTLWNFGVTSVIAAALHVSDTAIYLGPSVQVGTYQASAEGSQSLAFAGRARLTAGAATGLRLHMRDEKTGKLAYVLGVEIIAPVAGPSPWFLTAQISLGSGK